MSEVAKYSMVSGTVVGTIAAIIGILLFYTLHSLNTNILSIIVATIGTIIVGLFLSFIALIVLLALVAIFGGDPQQALREFFAPFLAQIAFLIMLGYFQGLDYSLKISLYNPYFAILMVVSGILISVGFFSRFLDDRDSTYLLGRCFRYSGNSCWRCTSKPSSTAIIELCSWLVFTRPAGYRRDQLLASKHWLCSPASRIYGFRHYAPEEQTRVN